MTADPNSGERQAAVNFCELVDNAQHGSAEALAELLEPCRGYLLLVANRALSKELRSKVGASDLVQDTFIRAKQGIEGFSGASEADLLAWLRRILLNHFADVTRSFMQTEKRRLDLEAPWPDDRTPLAVSPVTPAETAIAAEEIERMQQAVAKLPEEYRRAVELRSLQRLPFSSVAAELNRSEEAARKLWTRAIAKLSEMLGSADDDN